jgi:hypothetical protein
LTVRLFSQDRNKKGSMVKTSEKRMMWERKKEKLCSVFERKSIEKTG